MIDIFHGDCLDAFRGVRGLNSIVPVSAGIQSVKCLDSADMTSAFCPCGIPVPRLPPSKKPAKFCSRKCAGEAKRTYPKTAICKACATSFVILDCHSHRETCSGACALVRAPRPHTRVARPICGTCSVTFEPKSNIAMSKAKFCSDKCRALFRSVDPTWRARLAAQAPKGHLGWTKKGRAPWFKRMTGARNPAWKGGVTLLNGKGLYKGARYTSAPSELRCMARRDGWIMEHRLVMALWCGRPLSSVEVVHHVDHNPRNNPRSNLELWPNNSTHKRMESGQFCEGAACDIGARVLPRLP